jgi:RNA polymerase sigma-70 factor (ECF subfamily)
MSKDDHRSGSPAGRHDDEARWAGWMGRALQGDRDAYASLMGELGSAIESYLFSRFGLLRGSDFLEDCVQESLLAIHQVRHTYDTRRPFRPWVFTIVRHKTLDLLRRQKVRNITAPLEVGDGTATTGMIPALADQLDGTTLLACLEPAHREALVLTKLEGLSIQEAASRVGISESAMKSRIHRAIRAIRARLRKEELL